jgi:tetratricopeptide (TPR) repeat protein
VVEQHGAVTQRIHYLNILAMMALQRDRYFNSNDAITYSRQALALSLETANLGKIADMHFRLGFSYLWNEYLNEAEKALQRAREMAEQSHDLVLLTRALSYLAVVYRKRGDIERVREYAAYGLRIAGEAKMPQYTGSARAQLAWLAWRASDLAETKQEAAAAIEAWGKLGRTQSVMPFHWFALFPLLGVALQEEEIEQAVQWAQHLITPPQQRLPDDLATLLAWAVAAGEKGQWSTASDLLRHALQLARALHYI